MAELSWLPEALADIQRLHTFLYSKNPDAAAKAAQLILNTAAILQSHPRVGRPMPDKTGRRELFAAYGAGAYVVRYKLVDDNHPVIIRVWHSRESRTG